MFGNNVKSVPFQERKARTSDQFWRGEPEKRIAFVVTTNGMVRQNGEAVMGGGIARQAAQMFPTLPRQLGIALRDGNQCYVFNTNTHTIVTMPTKEDWRDPSTMDLVVKSARELADLAVAHRWDKVHVPQPGCGLGGLDWEEVRNALAPIWNERFVVWSL